MELFKEYDFVDFVLNLGTISMFSVIRHFCQVSTRDTSIFTDEVLLKSKIEKGVKKTG